MTDVKEDLERKAFEEWYCSSISESIGLERYPNGCYCNPEAENMYLSWCAAKSHATQSKWISVEDRLPEVNGRYLGFNNNTGRAGAVEFYKPYNWKGIFHNHHILDVTHWQPLPEPPAQGDK
jgi:hypothetical protein|nr:MAG TPA: Protein of unknown function (DUF551) [Caudoviricetes sp.]